MSNLQEPGKMCADEFGKLFSKGQFRTTLINTINKLQEEELPEIKPPPRADANQSSSQTTAPSPAKRSAGRPQKAGRKAWPRTRPSLVPGEPINDSEEILEKLADRL